MTAHDAENLLRSLGVDSITAHLAPRELRPSTCVGLLLRTNARTVAVTGPDLDVAIQRAVAVLEESE